MLWRYMELGGPLMWPLLGCSILLGGLLFERLWTVVVRQRILRRQVPMERLAWHRRVLPFFTEVPPSLGLLGTVVGVANSLGAISGRLDVDAVGAGLSVAIMTTIFGLGIAITAAVSGYALDWAGAGFAPAERKAS